MYKEQSIRLLRTSWKNPDVLAEELYAIFQQETPVTLDGPITIRTQPGQPGIIFEQPNDDFGVIDPIQTRPALPTPEFPPEEEEPEEESGDQPTPFEPEEIPEPEEIEGEPQEEEEEDEETKRVVIVRTYAGQVIEGTGKLWSMKVWNQGMDKEPNTYKVNILGVADDVVAVPDAYYLVTLYLVQEYRGEELVRERATFVCIPPVWL